MLAEVESLSRRMADCAGRGEWSELGELLARRDELTRRMAPAELAASLHDLLSETRELLELARAARTRVGEELRRLEAGRRAVEAYGGAAGQASRREIAARADSEKTAASG